MFSFLTLNLRFGLANDGSHDWEFRKTVYPSLLNKYRSDFICFQEANDFQIDFIQSILNDYRYIGKRNPAPKFWQNNVIFYSKEWECVHNDHFFLSHTPDVPSRFAKSRWPRQCTIGIFKKNNFRLICTNTHFDFDSVIQEKSAELILDRFSKLPDNLPIVLAGDFNATHRYACYKTFTGSRLQFKNVFTGPLPGTYHGFTGEPNGDHIDWILYRGSISIQASEIIKYTYKGIFPSDHFPLKAVFQRS